MKTLHELFLAQLGDIYYAENQLTKALPKMAKAASHKELRNVFENHLSETEGHLDKVESVFEAFDELAKAKKCDAILGLIEEGEKLASEYKKSPALNAALIAAAQKVEHYEIATYGCLREWAESLGNSHAVETLDEILVEEKAADQALTELARSLCNRSASITSGQEDEVAFTRR